MPLSQVCSVTGRDSLFHHSSAHVYALVYSFLNRNCHTNKLVPTQSCWSYHQTHSFEFVHFSIHSLHSPVCSLKAKTSAPCIFSSQVPGTVPWIKWVWCLWMEATNEGWVSIEWWPRNFHVYEPRWKIWGTFWSYIKLCDSTNCVVTGQKHYNTF